MALLATARYDSFDAAGVPSGARVQTTPPVHE